MISDTHLATLQAMGITLYTPRSHSITFDERSVEASSVGNSIEHLSQQLPKQARSHRSSTSSSHIDQIKSMLKGKTVGTEIPVTSEPRNSVGMGNNDTQANQAIPTSQKATEQLPINNSTEDSINPVESPIHSSSTLSPNPASASIQSSTNTSLRELVSARWFSDFQLSLPEQYRQTVVVSEMVNVASVLHEQLVLPLQLIVPAPQSQLLHSQILALYVVGENTNG